jgi:hypothetical protein
MLGQALGMAGRYTEAVAARSPNVDLQQSSEALRSILPGTYCYLALDSAKAGDEAAFERWADALCFLTPAGNDTQWRFNAAILVRGLVALGRHEEAIEWSHDGRQIFGTRFPTRILLDDAPIASHPETSLLRALCRAHKRLGAPEHARALAARVPISERTLIGWLAALVHLEANPTAELQAELTSLHGPATRFHDDLTTSRGGDLERAIDRVWY